MANTNVIKMVIQLRRDTTENWLANKDIVPAAGEPCYDLDLKTLKIGDGKTAYENLKSIGTTELSSAATHYEGIRAEDEDDNDVISRVLSEAGVDANKDDIFIVKSLISDNHYSHTAYVYNGENWVAMDGNYSANNVYFDSDMLVTKEIGYITLKDGQGYIPSEGKNLTEVFEAMFVKESNPKTTAPTVGWDSISTGSYEVGTTITPSWDAKLNAGSYTYGPATGIVAESWEISNNVTDETATTESGSFADWVVNDSMVYQITAKASHTAGATPVTNKGNEYASGAIAAGSKSTQSTGIFGYRAYFYGVLDTSTTDAPLTSAIIREQLTNGGNYNEEKSFTLNGSATAKRIVIAIPSNSTRGGLSEVILASAMNTPVTDSYVKTVDAVDVEGVNGATAVPYTVYVYEPSKIDAGEVHAITLA